MLPFWTGRLRMKNNHQLQRTRIVGIWLLDLGANVVFSAKMREFCVCIYNQAFAEAGTLRLEFGAAILSTYSQGDADMIRRELSTKTWEELDGVASKIRTRGETIKDEEICAMADEVKALLRRLTVQYLIEDEKAEF